MSRTNSIKFPNMIDVASNKVGLYKDNESIINRTRLLFLSDPTSLYNNPTFGVGLKRYLFQYNNANTFALIKDKMIAQLKEYEWYVNAEQTSFAEGLLFSDRDNIDLQNKFNRLDMTVGLKTVYNDTLEVKLNGDR